jgi:uncharacterized protein
METHPHGAMRRKDREITDRDEINAILASGKVMHLALCDGATPFLVPLFYAFDGTALFFHSANAGRKIEILKRNSQVCFSVSLDHGVIESDQACDFEARHRTVIGFGIASFVESHEEKIQALDRIVGQFTTAAFKYPEANVRCTAVIRIDIASVKGKKHGL